jgi:GTP-binding protein
MTFSSASASSRARLRSGEGRGLLGRSVGLVLAGHHVGERPLLGVKVARVSQTPGRTQALYWYRVDEIFDVVDCPGYGFAKTAKEKRAGFAEMIEAFLTSELPPAAALLLLDGRLEPQESDRSMALFLREANVFTVVAATKWDAVKPSERVRRLRTLTSEFQDSERPLLPVSSETGENLPGLARLLRDRLRTPSST